ncbi:MAG: hypothetical protein IPN77_05270 [Sandaracinaceae bacterium]|nr:hypothetical protein [Sandaracinaceae bacterium]
MTRLLFLSLVLLVGCGGSQPSEPPATTEPSAAVEEPPVEQPPIEQPPVDDGTGPAADSQDVREALASANQLGFDLYARMRGTPGNLVMSPASVHLALSMTYAGARGETASQMASVLHLGPPWMTWARPMALRYGAGTAGAPPRCAWPTASSRTAACRWRTAS